MNLKRISVSFFSLLLASQMTISAQNVSFSTNKVTLKSAFEKIEKASKYKIAYNSSQLNANRSVTLSKKSDDVFGMLTQLLKETNCTYELEGNYIIIKPLQKAQTSGKKVKVRGVIKDETGEPIIGATVRVKGQSEGTVSDFDGNFTLEYVAEVAQYSNIFVRSIWLAAIATVICLVISYPVAFILARMDIKVQSTMVMIIVLPMWMNFLLRTYAWMTILGNEGIINTLLGYIGLGPYKMLNTQGAVVLGMVYDYLPYMVLPLYSVMVKIDKSVLEAAQDLGCNSLKSLFRVVLPLSLPGVMSGITMVFVPAISTFIISRMLGGGSNLLIGDLIEMQFLGNSYNPNLGAGISLVLMVIILLIMTLMNQFDVDDDRVLV